MSYLNTIFIIIEEIFVKENTKYEYYQVHYRQLCYLRLLPNLKKKKKIFL